MNRRIMWLVLIILNIPGIILWTQGSFSLGWVNGVVAFLLFLILLLDR